MNQCTTQCSYLHDLKNTLEEFIVLKNMSFELSSRMTDDKCFSLKFHKATKESNNFNEDQVFCFGFSSKFTNQFFSTCMSLILWFGSSVSLCSSSLLGNHWNSGGFLETKEGLFLNV